MKSGVTLKEVAGIAGVSIRTVSLAISGEGRMSATTRERILCIARELNYHPNLAAKSLRLRKSFLIGTVLPYLNISFFNRIIGGIEERCFEAGYDILLASPPDGSPARETGSLSMGSGALDRMVARKVDGIIAAPTSSAFGPYQRIVKMGMPLLQVLTRIQGLKAPFIGVDNVRGGYLAARHLTELGHTKIGFLKSSTPHYTEVEQRYEGYLTALVERGIRVDTKRTCMEAGTLGDIDAATAATERLLRQAPELTAIFAPTDYAALGAIKACKSRGLSVPGDVSIIGYDDLEIASQQLEHPLSTIAQPKEEIGHQAVDMLLDLMAGKAIADKLVTPVLVTRATTSRAGRGRGRSGRQAKAARRPS